jgi:hypothetical protein
MQETLNLRTKRDPTAKLQNAVTGLARAVRMREKLSVSLLAFLVYCLSGRPNATFPFLCCIMRASFTTIFVLTSLQAPKHAFKSPAKYARETVLHFALAGFFCKILVVRGSSTAQAPWIIPYVHSMLCSLAFAMAGIPLMSTVPLPATANGCCWLLSMFASTILGIILPTLRWYLCNHLKPPNTEGNAPWDVAQISFLGCVTVSAVWLVLSQIAAVIE